MLKYLGIQGINFFGKNYYPNSELYFEYFDGVVKRSYPDFILKDKAGNIHIFEVKSLNQSLRFNINTEEYDLKIRNIAECYKYVSKITSYTLYIPIQVNAGWIIEKFHKGISERIVKDQLVEILNT